MHADGKFAARTGWPPTPPLPPPTPSYITFCSRQSTPRAQFSLLPLASQTRRSASFCQAPRPHAWPPALPGINTVDARPRCCDVRVQPCAVRLATLRWPRRELRGARPGRRTHTSTDPSQRPWAAEGMDSDPGRNGARVEAMGRDSTVCAPKLSRGSTWDGVRVHEPGPALGFRRVQIMYGAVATGECETLQVHHVASGPGSGKVCIARSQVACAAPQLCRGKCVYVEEV